uniref:Wbp11/ELF5/Saf1 N-terminal domain-containing protein n=1 Tax=Microcebus murinus TaxID=30608 RepID=A0A8C5VCS9_MICMU
MGRRSTSSTKSGKFMNPTDQARKEARKRELKNKKQHMMVQAAVLKMKDPKQIIWDMGKLDEMEFNPVQQPQLNKKVLKDKRKKLRETFECILRLYEKENPDIYKELRKLEVEYEQKRANLTCYIVLNLLSGVTTMMFPAPVKMTAILRTWIKISMMTVTLTDQMEKVRGMNLYIVMIMKETTMKKKVRSKCTICRYAWKIKEEKEHEGADSSSSDDASHGCSGNP